MGPEVPMKEATKPWDDPERLCAVSAILLSPVCSLEESLRLRREKMSGAADTVITDACITEMFTDADPSISRRKDRLGKVPVLTYILSTYQNGLPSLGVMQGHTKHAMRGLIACASKMEAAERAPGLKRVAEAFQSCQVGNPALR